MAKDIKLDYSSLWEAVKQPLRLLIAAVIGWGISQLAQYIPFLNQVDEKWIWGVATTIVATLDKTLHDFGKDNNVTWAVKGITGWVKV